MKKLCLSATALAAICCSFFLGGCMKDSYQKSYTYTYYIPVYKTTAEVRANIKSNPPRAIEQPGKIFVLGSYIFLTDIDRGIHVIDNSNPAQPHNVSFIDLPGNMDIAVKGNTLYADLYTDLVAIDISNPTNISLKKVVGGVFPERYYAGSFIPDSTRVIAYWLRKDTTVTERANIGFLKTPDVYMMYTANASGQASSVSPYGVGGSTARFTIVNERLYTVGESNLHVFNISNAINPLQSQQLNLAWNIETIYPFRNKLFIGSTTGMFIYDIANPDNPVQEGQFSHVQSCDPVIADDNFAYVTLRSGTSCNSTTNEMDVLRLNNLSNPALVKTYSMINPHGLSKDGNTLFVCDGKAGLKIFNASDALNLNLVKTIQGIETSDVITMNGRALVVASDGLYQYDYSNLSDVRLLSKISISK